MTSPTPPTLDFDRSIQASENLAAVIYNLSELCLMAHTLRAVEWHITEEYNKDEFPIILVVEPGVLKRWRSKSWCFPTASFAYIWIDDSLDRDQKRICIAHEAYHILEYFKPVKSDPVRLEDICDQFANALCRQHDGFYRNPDKIKACMFGRLPINSKRNAESHA